MHIVAIGDTHGRRTWQRVVALEQDATRVVFLGDFFDSWHETPADQLDNFYKILAYKRANPEKVVLLMGNHDFQYILHGERYSGYNAIGAPNYKVAIEDALSDRSLLVAYEEEGYLFSHAGVTKTWAYVFELNPKDIANEINFLFRHNPLAFSFDRRDASGCGEDKRQSPLWVRPGALLPDMLKGYVQVVGHTTQREGIDTSLYDQLILADAIDIGEYLVIQKEGLLVGKV